MIGDKTVHVVIPARGGSERLPRKNIYPVWGKPMIYWAIRASHMCQYVDKIFVSTEDEEIANISISHGATLILRPPRLSESHVFKQDVIIHAVEVMDKKPDIVISLQPNSPEIDHRDLTAAIDKFVKYDRNEIFTVNENLIQNAAFRIMKVDYVFQKSISTRCGVYVTKYVDVHDIDNVEFLEANREPCRGTTK